MQQMKQLVIVNQHDIFNYVVGHSQYDPLEKAIDPSRYEVFEYFIYDIENRERIEQESDYIAFCCEVSRLKRNAPKMSQWEIRKLCEELAEIAPQQVKLI